MALWVQSSEYCPTRFLPVYWEPLLLLQQICAAANVSEGKECKEKGKKIWEVHVESLVFCEVFPGGILLLKESGEAVTRADPLHLQPDSGCHRSKWKRMLGKLFGNMPHSGEKERLHSWDFTGGKNIRQSTLKLALSSQKSRVYLTKGNTRKGTLYSTGACNVFILDTGQLYYPCP